MTLNKWLAPAVAATALTAFAHAPRMAQQNWKLGSAPKPCPNTSRIVSNTVAKKNSVANRPRRRARQG